MVLEILASILAVAGAALVLSVAVAQFRARDAVSRINALGPATALGLPLIVVASALGWTAAEGLDLMLWAKTAVTVMALLIVSSVASNVLARATCRTDATLDPRTEPNDLMSET
jgi:monovalent cation/proton (H+) antiporter subunit G